MNIVIDNEFKNLIPPLTPDEYAGLKQSIMQEGCRDPIVLWGDILIDGHNRYEICKRHNIKYDTVQMQFASRDEARDWIIDNQCSRRNISDAMKIHLQAMKSQYRREQARKQQGTRNDLFQNSEKSNIAKPVDVTKEIAKATDTSIDTVSRVMQIEKKAPEQLQKAVFDGDVSVNAGYQVTKLEPELQEEIAQRIERAEEKPKEIVQDVLKRPHVSFNSGNNEWYTPAEIIEAARKAMGSIDTDPASNDIAQKVVKSKSYYTIEKNGLDKTWTGNVWMNPPYSGDLIGRFIDKLCSERCNYEQAIVLVNNATETEWFNKIISIASVVCFVKSRVKFWMPDGKTGAPLQGQAIVYIGNESDRFANAFESVGWCANVIRR